MEHLTIFKSINLTNKIKKRSYFKLSKKLKKVEKRGGANMLIFDKCRKKSNEKLKSQDIFQRLSQIDTFGYQKGILKVSSLFFNNVINFTIGVKHHQFV